MVRALYLKIGLFNVNGFVGQKMFDITRRPNNRQAQGNYVAYEQCTHTGQYDQTLSKNQLCNVTHSLYYEEFTPKISLNIVICNFIVA